MDLLEVPVVFGGDHHPCPPRAAPKGLQSCKDVQPQYRTIQAISGCGGSNERMNFLLQGLSQIVNQSGV